MKTILKNFTFNTAYQMFLIIVPIVTTPYVSRVLGPKGVGVNSYTYSIAQYFCLIAMFGFSLYGSREIAYTRDNKKTRSKQFWSIYLVQLVFVLLTSLFYAILVINSDDFKIPLLIQGISVLACGFDVSWYFFGLEKFSVTVSRNFLVKMASIAAIFIFVKTRNDLNLYILINVLSSLLGNLALLPFLRKSVAIVRVEIADLWKSFKESSILFIPQLAVSIYVILNKTVLGIVQNTTEVGFFDSSDKIVRLLLAVMTSAATVMMPFVAHQFSTGSHQIINRITSLTIRVTLFFAVPLVAGIMIIADRFVPLFFGSAFTQVVPVMVLESPIILFVGLASVMGNQFLLPTRQSRKYTLSLVLGAVIDLIVILPLTVSFGAIGGAVSVLLAEATVCLTQGYFVRKSVNFDVILKESWKYLAGAAIMWVPATIIKIFIKSNMLSVVLLVGVCGLAYLATEWMLKPSILSWFVNRISTNRS
ncbi:oligosaccharide flippase family protein [Lacticaseibacillus paracasei]|uniref:oligosaccharide flippase family protein n=1 Tax=Lacticaseibacillus paracasei TaxID=1597 RepID=UPI0031EC187D